MPTQSHDKPAARGTPAPKGNTAERHGDFKPPRTRAEERAAQEDRGLHNTVGEKVGTHPIASTVGGVGGAAAGAVSGLVFGPMGSLAGAAVGAALGATGGAVGGTGPADDVSDDRDAPPRIDGLTPDDHSLAFRYGADAHAARAGRSWQQLEAELARGWDHARGRSTLSWDEARATVQQGWQRSEEAVRQPDGGGRYVV